MPGVVLIVSISDTCLLPYFLYSHEYRLTRKNVYCAILLDQIVVGCPLGVNSDIIIVICAVSSKHLQCVCRHTKSYPAGDCFLYNTT